MVEGEADSAQVFQQSVIDGVADAIMVIDNDYQVILMNRAAREFASGDSALSKPVFCYQLSHHLPVPCDGVEHPCPLEKVRELRRPVTVIHEHLQADGEKRIIELIASPLSGADGSFQGIIESMRDVTERQQAEKVLRRSTRRLRALTSQLAEVSEAERQRLSQELHDQVGQNLTTLGINLNIIKAEIGGMASVSLLSRLVDSLALVEQTTERIRDVMAELRPPVLDDYGLAAALRWYGRIFSQRTTIKVSVKGEELNPRLPTRMENAFFRIAQEALNNVAKHAQANRVVVSLGENQGTVRLVISDNGTGFDPVHVVENDDIGGWGLLSMTERAEAEGGRCRIESGAGGTSVFVEVER
jgi:signal transduction histidine kinase